MIDALLAGKTVNHSGEFTASEARLDGAPGRLPLAIAGLVPGSSGCPRSAATG